MERDFKTVGHELHQNNPPPPNEKNDRKKLDAAKATERPKTTWTPRRKPPEVSPKAQVKPVRMIAIQATIFATGPCTDSNIFWSGCSHGMLLPAARAACEVSTETTPIPVPRVVLKTRDIRLIMEPP